MAKKVIQVPVDERLLGALNSMSKKRGQSRSDLIRTACVKYLKQAEQEQLDAIYQEGYRRLPEKPSLGEAQAALAAHILPEDPW